MILPIFAAIFDAYKKNAWIQNDRKWDTVSIFFINKRLTVVVRSPKASLAAYSAEWKAVIVIKKSWFALDKSPQQLDCHKTEPWTSLFLSFCAAEPLRVKRNKRGEKYWKRCYRWIFCLRFLDSIFYSKMGKFSKSGHAKIAQMRSAIEIRGKQYEGADRDEELKQNSLWLDVFATFGLQLSDVSAL